jgi:hypothetical protein
LLRKRERERERERERVYSSRKPLLAAAAAASDLWGGNMTLITLHALYIYGGKEVCFALHIPTHSEA